ncbi:MAG: 2-phospho-L-lactate guanylyltransferase, partial [Methanosarcinales archaeon]|nr:2-phospho-L-lactate guanylyltransferase [Methanosarcinales archaeon]
MKAIKTVIPFKPDNPKSRLSAALTEEERKVFAGLSLENVLSVLKESGIKQV